MSEDIGGEIHRKVERWVKEWQGQTDLIEATLLDAEKAKRGFMRLQRQMTDEERHVLTAEHLLDSFIQEKEKNWRKVRVALAEIRALRNSRIARGFEWQYTLTNPRINPEKAIAHFGYSHESKRWSYQAKSYAIGTPEAEAIMKPKPSNLLRSPPTEEVA